MGEAALAAMGASGSAVVQCVPLEDRRSRPSRGFLASALLACALVVGPLAHADDHGDDLSSATRVALPSETAGVMDSGDDEDWFRFEVAARGEVVAETIGMDTWGVLYDATGHALALDDESGRGHNFRIRRMLDAGTYFLRVGSWWPSGNYVLRATGPNAGHLHRLGDFDGDGKDDVLLRHQDGRWRLYLMDGRAVLAGGGAVSLTADLAWRVAGIGDFDGDGKDDALLRHQDGRWHYYSMNGDAVLAGSGPANLTTNLAWQVAGIGDFNGDDRTDVLLRHGDGRWRYYAMDGRARRSGGGPANLTTNLAWQVAGIGDFNGDGRDDVLLRHENGRWRYYAMDGRTRRSGGGAVDLTADTTIAVAGIGDMNGDGRADVLARGTDGSWHYYALDSRRLLSVSGEAALTGNLAWVALSSGGRATGATTAGRPLGDRSLPLGRDEAIDLSEAFVDDQTLTYEVRSSDSDVVRSSVTANVLTLMPVAEGRAAVMVTARDPDGNLATQTIAVTVGLTFRDCAACPLMVRVPAGTFTMGAPESEPFSLPDERPQRTVSISAFAAGAYEVTFAEWGACVAAGGCERRRNYRWPSTALAIPDDEGWGRGDRPVINVNWFDVQLYVDWLSGTTGQRYRLLTESEWEYAARAGTTTAHHTGETITPQQANFNGRVGYSSINTESVLYRGQTVPVGSFAPNGFGLYDMHGNVNEWVQDCVYLYAEAGAPSDGSAVECDRDNDEGGIYRGGAWYSVPWGNIRSASRGFVWDHQRSKSIGFRVARTL